MGAQKKEAFERAFRNFKDRFREKLSIPSLEMFHFTSRADFEQSLESIQSSQTRDRKMRNMNRLSKFLEAMKSIDEVVHVFLNSTKYLGIIYGPMKLLLVISKNYLDAFDLLLDTYSEIGRTMPLLKRYEALDKGSTPLEEAIVETYEVVLEFHVQAIGYFQSGSWKKLFHASWKTFMTRFKPYMDKLESIKCALEQHALLNHMTHFEQQAREFQKLRDEQVERFKKQVQFEDEQHEIRIIERRKYLQQWLVTDKQGDQDQDHVNHLKRREKTPSSGQWVLRKPQVQSWLDSQRNEASVLWITGKPGAGKSVLASLIIDHCEQVFQSEHGVVVIRFYCKYGINTRDNFFALARSLIWQMACEDETLLEWLHSQASWSGLSTLHTKDKLCKDLLTTVLKSMSVVYVIIDGLDECHMNEVEEVNEIETIEEFFGTLCKSTEGSNSTSVRCLFVSQRDRTCSKLLSKYPTLEVQESDIQSDIEAFTKQEVQLIQKEFQLDAHVATELADRLVEQSEGMFLYAKLVTQNLLGQVDLLNLQAEIQAPLPRGISGAYDRIMHRIINHENPERNERILQVLGLVAAARRPLKWREIRGALATVVSKRSVNLLGRGLRGDIKQYCSSFIDERPNEDNEFVHQTARSYIINDARVNIQAQNLQTAKICAALLAGNGFGGLLRAEDSSIQPYIKSGYYSFATYAVAFWASHAAYCVRTRAEGSELNLLGKELVALLEQHFVSPVSPIAIEKDFKDFPVILEETWPRLQDIQMAMSATARQLHSNDPRSATNEVLCLPQKIKNLHAAIERYARIAPRTVFQFYGHLIYKCPRMSCTYFSEGFRSAALRDAHVVKHERPFRCTFAFCDKAIDGFKSRRELRVHLNTIHNVLDSEETFPSRKDFAIIDEHNEVQTDAPAPTTPIRKFICEHCCQAFTRRHTMQTHLESKHSGERRFHCVPCAKSFGKASDLNRHDRNIHKGQKPFECWGKVGMAFSNDRIWGCGDRFARPYQRLEHITRSSEDDGSNPCIAPLLQQARTASGKYVCRGLFRPYFSEMQSASSKVASFHATRSWGCGSYMDSARDLLKHWKQPEGREMCLKQILEREHNDPNTGFSSSSGQNDSRASLHQDTAADCSNERDSKLYADNVQGACSIAADENGSPRSPEIRDTHSTVDEHSDSSVIDSLFAPPIEFRLEQYESTGPITRSPQVDQDLTHSAPDDPGNPGCSPRKRRRMDSDQGGCFVPIDVTKATGDQDGSRE